MAGLLQTLKAEKEQKEGEYNKRKEEEEQQKTQQMESAAKRKEEARLKEEMQEQAFQEYIRKLDWRKRQKAEHLRRQAAERLSKLRAIDAKKQCLIETLQKRAAQRSGDVQRKNESEGENENENENENPRRECSLQLLGLRLKKQQNVQEASQHCSPSPESVTHHKAVKLKHFPIAGEESTAE